MTRSREFYLNAFKRMAFSFSFFRKGPAPEELKNDGIQLIRDFVGDYGVLDAQEWGYNAYTNLLNVWFGSSAFLHIRKKPWVVPTQKNSLEFLNNLFSLQNIEKLEREMNPVDIKQMATEILIKIKYARGDFDDWDEVKISEFREKPRNSKSPFKSKDEWKAFGIILKAEEHGF
jgi:hypothetical protein